MQFGYVLSTRSLGYRGGSVPHLGLLIGWLSVSVSFFLVKCSPEEKLRMNLWTTDYSVFLHRTVVIAGNVSINKGNSRKQIFIYRYHKVNIVACFNVMSQNLRQGNDLNR